MERTPANLYDPLCPSRMIVDIIGSRWGMLLICNLEKGPMRTNALIRAIGGVSEKMFRQTARELEYCGILTRTSYPEVPPRVEYGLTPLGQSLCKVIRGLEDWVVANYDAMMDSREREKV